MQNFFITSPGYWALILAAYLLGSLSFAVIVTRLMGQTDPRSYGSKNPGATNVLRAGNKTAALLTLLLDAAKGWLAVFTTIVLGAPAGLISAVLIAVFLGHLYPLFFKFAGGKGVATALGILLAINPWLGLATLAIWLVIAGLLRYASLAAIISAIAAPIIYTVSLGTNPISLAISLISLLLIWRHRSNIRHLIAGTEGRLGRGQAALRQRRP